MIAEKKISINDFVHALLDAVNIISPALNNHHQKVAYVAYRIAQEMKLPGHEIRNIILASLLHDIGVFLIGEKKTLEFMFLEEDEIKEHALLGYRFLKGFEPLTIIARLIRYHHTDYEKSGSRIPIGSCIIHLADRVCVLFNEQREILAQVPQVLENIAQRNYKFHPEALLSFGLLARLEVFWDEIFTPSFCVSMKKELFPNQLMLNTMQST
jgi:response regulator RpfG family c-di-GMP phosphodiesterase